MNLINHKYWTLVHVSLSQIDLLPEIREAPHILSEVDAVLKAKQMKADVDEYLKVLLSFYLCIHWLSC